MLRSKQFKDIAAALTFVNENKTLKPLHFVPVTTTYPDGILLIYEVIDDALALQVVKLFEEVDANKAKALIGNTVKLLTAIEKNDFVINTRLEENILSICSQLKRVLKNA